ncbi:MAG: hypothetical protein AAF125_13125, partial [Chloroflexota bacterium]
MQTLLQTLNETDEAVLATIAASWGVADRPADRRAFAELLEVTMLDEANAERLWDTLPDDQRQALQTLLGGGGSMMMSMFKHMFGDIRKMGRGGIEREQPHQRPASAAEALFYKGFLSETIRMGASGGQAMAYVPDDLALVLPKHKTAYDNLEDEDGSGGADPLSTVDARGLSETRLADTSVVDDLTALLAFAQLHTPPVEGDSLAEGSLRALMPCLLTHGTDRVAFMVTVAVSMDLLALYEGQVRPNREVARKWLSATRSEQIEQLVRAWLDSEYYYELGHIPELEVERADSYDPRLARRVLQKALAEAVPASEWWEMDELIHVIKSTVPDFQRPNGDYDSWYILDALNGDYLRGFESWD